MENLRDKVKARLLEMGRNENDVKEMMDLHFETASSEYTTVKYMAEYIITVYS